MNEIKQIIAAYDTARQQQKKAALATVVHIEGSSYRGPGARMLVNEEGFLTGAISGGCLEGDALRKALLVMMEGKPQLVTYDTSDEEDAAIGVNLGCNGMIRVLIEPIRADDGSNPIALLKKAVESREPSVLITHFTLNDKKNPQQGTKWRLTQADQDVSPDIQQVLYDREAAFVAYPPTSTYPAGFTAFIEYLEPPVVLVIAGAGNDVMPLVQLAAVLGWESTLIDGRPSYASHRRFPDCRVLVADPAKALDGIPIDERTAVLLMSHNFHYDKGILEAAIRSRSPYIGLLGPKKKLNKMLQELAGEGTVLDEQELNRIYGPIGLDIGAETAAEIALSVLAEIQAVFAHRQGGYLRRESGSIHQRTTQIKASLSHYGILVLAAGMSRRMGSPKQQLPFKGTTLLRHAAEQACQAGVGVTMVVLGAQAAILEQELSGLAVEVVINPEYEEGMASSIRRGVEHVTAKYPMIDHLLIMLCDQPFVDSRHLRSLIETQQKGGASLVASAYAGKKAVPALFHADYFSQLMTLKGDRGARELIEQTGDNVVGVPLERGEMDIDTIYDLRQLS